MVKFSNKAKSKPSKRQNLKTKYKIDRKVKQHKKKMKKEAKKLKNQGIKLKRGQKANPLPNMFPFKNQILQYHKSQRPDEAPSQVPLVPSEWGMITLENRSPYFPKDKSLLLKKYLTCEEKLLDYATLILDVVDSRKPFSCIDEQFRERCTKKGIKLITVLAKVDTVMKKQLDLIREKFEGRKETFVQWTSGQKRKGGCLDDLKRKITEVAGENNKVVVVGKPKTGKHTLIKEICKHVKFSFESSSDMFEVPFFSEVYVLDTPYNIADKTDYPLFNVPRNLQECSQISQQQQVLKKLFFGNSLGGTRSDILMHFNIQDYSSLDDLLKKVGKVNRIFGKGGMVDLAAVREKLLSEWYSGSLNYIFQVL